MRHPMAICDWCLPYQGPGGILLAAEAGFDGIQIGDLDGAANGYLLSQKSIQKAYLKAVRQSGILLQTLHLRRLAEDGDMLFPEGTAQSERAKDSIEKGIDACDALEIDRLFLSSFFGSYIYNDYEFRNFAIHARYACELAAARGITVVYECVLPLPRMLEILNAVGKEMKILYDTLNPYTFGSGDTAIEIAALGTERIDQVHVKDRYEDYKTFCLLGEGVGRYEKGVEALRAIDWSGWVVNESFHHLMSRTEREDSLTLMREDLRRMRASFNW